MGKKLIEEARRCGIYKPYRQEFEFAFSKLYYMNTLFTYMLRKPQPIRINHRFLVDFDHHAAGIHDKLFVLLMAEHARLVDGVIRHQLTDRKSRGGNQAGVS